MAGLSFYVVVGLAISGFLGLSALAYFTIDVSEEEIE